MTGTQGEITSVELFQREDCPQSHAVRRRLSDLNVDYVTHNVPAGDPLKHLKLTQLGGKDEIPFLINHHSGVKLYGAPAILAYLEKEHGKKAPSGIVQTARLVEKQLRERADDIAWTLQSPLESLIGMRDEMREAVGMIQGGLRFVRSVVGDRLRTKNEASTSGTSNVVDISAA